MSNMFIGFSIIFLFVCLLLVIPILMSVYVYRDAKRRGMNAVLWTLISLLAPGFVGLIIYLIIRSEHSDLRCKSCDNMIKPSFAVCPYCGAPLKEHCPNCGFTLEADWTKCPECGEDIPEDIRRSQHNGKNKDKGLKGILLAVILIPLSLCVLMFLGLCSLTTYTGRGSSSSTIAMSSLDQIICEPDINAEALNEWVAECDAAGPGAYILKAKENRKYDSGDYLTAFLLYCNNGYYTGDVNFDMGGWFTDATATFQCLPATGDDMPVFMFCEYISDEPCDPKVLCDGKQIDAQINEVDWSYFSGLSSNYFSNMRVTAEVDQSATEVYSVGCEYYSSEEPILDEHSLPANNESAADNVFFFTYPIHDYSNITHAIVTAYDKNENPIFTTQVDLRFLRSWIVNIIVDDNGELTAKVHEDI